MAMNVYFYNEILEPTKTLTKYYRENQYGKTVPCFLMSEFIKKTSKGTPQKTWLYKNAEIVGAREGLDFFKSDTERKVGRDVKRFNAWFISEKYAVNYCKYRIAKAEEALQTYKSIYEQLSDE